MKISIWPYKSMITQGRLRGWMIQYVWINGIILGRYFSYRIPLYPTSKLSKEVMLRLDETIERINALGKD
jgi:hypothetical protein